MKKAGIIAVIVLVVLGGWFIFSRGGNGPSPEVADGIIGKWQSVEDARFAREFKEENVVTDWYDGGEVMTGTWEMFTSRTAPRVSQASFNDDEATYLRMSLTGEELDMIYFQVASVDAENLELVYLDRGGVLEFTRVVEEEVEE